MYISSELSLECISIVQSVCLRYNRVQEMVQEELERIRRQEREAGQEELNTAMLRERAHGRDEAERAKQLVSDAPLPKSDWARRGTLQCSEDLEPRLLAM